MKKNLLKNILILGLGAEIFHVAEHIYWQTLSDGQMINVILTQTHNERSIVVNSAVALIIILAIYLIDKRLIKKNVHKG